MVAPQTKHYESELTLCDGVTVYYVIHPSEDPDTEDIHQMSQDTDDLENLLDRHINMAGRAEHYLTAFLDTRNIQVRNIHSRRGRLESLTRYIVDRPEDITPQIPQKKRKKGGTGSRAAAAGYPKTLLHSIDFRFVDAETGKPVPGVCARIIHDDGTHQDLVSGRLGYISRESLSPGTCTLISAPGNIMSLTVDKTVTTLTNGKASRSLFDEVKSTYPPARTYLCQVLEHQVQDGETLTSIAESHGLSFEDLSRFNWGTQDRKKALAAMKHDTGCFRLTETSDDCLFESANDPGIVFIPQPFEQNGFATGTGHTIRVSKTGFGAFKEPIKVTIKNEDGDPIPNLTCELTHADGTTKTVRTDGNGIITFTQTIASKTKIRIPGINSFGQTKA